MSVAENLADIKKRIEKACSQCGRNPDSVVLVAVSKTVDVPMIEEAKKEGQLIFGENRPQELCQKYPLIEGAEWHLIGHLQTNKVKTVVGKARLIHSVDSLRLAEAIDTEAKKKGVVQDILLELNISGEESKYGLTTEEIPNIIKSVNRMENVAFKGFMTMAPKNAGEDELHEIFGEAHRIFESYKEEGAEVLSMGMSGDFEAAIKEGATHIRVGSSIFKR